MVYFDLMAFGYIFFDGYWAIILDVNANNINGILSTIGHRRMVMLDEFNAAYLTLETAVAELSN